VAQILTHGSLEKKAIFVFVSGIGNNLSWVLFVLTRKNQNINYRNMELMRLIATE
jgi:hypothetical protein